MNRPHMTAEELRQVERALRSLITVPLTSIPANEVAREQPVRRVGGQ